MHMGESRFLAKKERREAGEKLWAFSDGKFHSHGTRNAYQQHIMAFIQWARAHHNVRRLEVLDQRADELATEYLSDRITQGKSPFTIQSERAALRFFFDNRQLAAQLDLPARKREEITRSRKPTVRAREFQPANWQPLLRFVDATGLRDQELKLLQVEDILAYGPTTHGPEVSVKKGHAKGGRPRQVPILPGREQDVLALREGRDPQERVFARVPSRLHAQEHRRAYAQAYYKHLSGRELPPAQGRLKRSDYDEKAVLQVSEALGHSRKDVVLRHYLR
ncbi:MAG: site-specific integrase [Ktedonobacteraceae bacterium]|nr:site-specific integrase [Ktedonobacteraceae bacterium]